ncbi:MAG: tetratricopeptide repeat protein [Candidatus Eremiobacteraeota bacterium]|nr:tetratricopeptide repeat protein [Candidatus Eremiobacteraeota bacterium]
MYTDEMAALAEEAAFQMLDRKNYGKALKLWQKLYDELDRLHPPPSFDKAEIALRIAMCQGRLGNHEDAIEIARDQVDYMSEFTGDDWDQVQEALLVLVQVAGEGGHDEVAIEASARALEALKDGRAETSPEAALRTALKSEWLAMRLGKPGLGLPAGDIVLQFLSREEKKLKKSMQGASRDDQLRDITFKKARLLESRARLHRGANDLEKAGQDLEGAVKHYERALGKGHETADEARQALTEVRELLG